MTKTSCDSAAAKDEEPPTGSFRFIKDLTKLNSRYDFVRILGSGSFGVTGLFCEKNDTKQLVAVKIVKITEDNKECYRREFFSKEHPNIVKCFEPWLEKLAGEKYFVIPMEYCSGGSLKDALKQRRLRLDNGTLAQAVLSILSGLQFLHDSHYIHRDLKPENIVLSNNGELKICDFGTHTSDLRKKFTPGVGTHLYIAPEAHTDNYGPKADVFSLGVILFEMFASLYVCNRRQIERYCAQVSKSRGKDIADIDIDPLRSNKIRIFIGQLLNENPKARPSVNCLLKDLRLYELLGRGILPRYVNEAAKNHNFKTCFELAHKFVKVFQPLSMKDIQNLICWTTSFRNLSSKDLATTDFSKCRDTVMQVYDALLNVASVSEEIHRLLISRFLIETNLLTAQAPVDESMVDREITAKYVSLSMKAFGIACLVDATRLETVHYFIEKLTEKDDREKALMKVYEEIQLSKTLPRMKRKDRAKSDVMISKISVDLFRLQAERMTDDPTGYLQQYREILTMQPVLDASEKEKLLRFCNTLVVLNEEANKEERINHSMIAVEVINKLSNCDLLNTTESLMLKEKLNEHKEELRSLGVDCVSMNGSGIFATITRRFRAFTQNRVRSRVESPTLSTIPEIPKRIKKGYERPFMFYHL